MNLIKEWYFNNIGYTLLLTSFLIVLIIYFLGIKLSKLPAEKIISIAVAIGSIPFVIFLFELINYFDTVNQRTTKDYFSYSIVLIMPVMLYFASYYNVKKMVKLSKEIKEEKERRKLEKKNKSNK